MIAEAIAAVAILAAVVAVLRLRVQRRRADRSDTANDILRASKRDLRAEADTLTSKLQRAEAELEAAVDTIAELRARVDEGLRWRRELRQARAEQESSLMKPHPNRSREERRADLVREAFNSAWEARFAAPAVTPPHEQDGATE